MFYIDPCTVSANAPLIRAYLLTAKINSRPSTPVRRKEDLPILQPETLMLRVRYMCIHSSHLWTHIMYRHSSSINAFMHLHSLCQYAFHKPSPAK